MSATTEAIVAVYCAGIYNTVIAKTLSIARSTVWKAIKCFNERGDFSDHQRSGRPCSKCLRKMIKAIHVRIWQNPNRSLRKMAKETKMSPRSMGRLVHENLGMPSFTLQKRQALSMAAEQKRFERSKVLLNELK